MLRQAGPTWGLEPSCGGCSCLKAVLWDKRPGSRHLSPGSSRQGRAEKGLHSGLAQVTSVSVGCGVGSLRQRACCSGRGPADSSVCDEGNGAARGQETTAFPRGSAARHGEKCGPRGKPRQHWNTRAVVCDQLIVKRHCTFGCLQTRFPQVTLAFGFPLKVQPRGGERHRAGTGIPPAFAQPLVLSFLTASSLAGQLRIPKLGTFKRMVRLALEVALGACAPMPHAASSQDLQTKLCTERW